MAVETISRPRPAAGIIIGTGVWLATLDISLIGNTELGLIEHLLLLAPLVIVPLGLSLLKVPEQAGFQAGLYQLVQVIQPFGAIGAVVSFFSPTGPWAALFAAGWLLVTVLAALLGLARLLQRGLRLQIEEICLDAGLLFLPVGGGWLVLARLGLNPLGFGDLIVLLTAVHFHYAGFAAPIITGVTGRALIPSTKTARRLYGAIAPGVIAGTPLVAVGITLSPLVELIGAVILAASLALLAGLTGLLILPTVSHRLARLLLAVSAGSVLVGMVFACAYAIGQFTGHYLVSIPQMARYHGLTNALGFALCGLVGWWMVDGRR